MPSRSNRAVKKIPLDDTFTPSQDSTPSQQYRRRSSRVARSIRKDGTGEGPISHAPVQTVDSLESAESHVETYETLPERVLVFAPVTKDEPPFSAGKNIELYERAEAVLSDSIVKGNTGRLSDLRAGKKRKRESIVPDCDGNTREVTEEKKLDMRTLWFSAAFSLTRLSKSILFLFLFIKVDCLTSGELQPASKAWSPFIPPPLTSQLSPLPPQPTDLNPLVGVDIPLWNVTFTDYMNMEQEELRDFQHEWHEADGTGWGMSTRDVYQTGSLARKDGTGHTDEIDWSVGCDDFDDNPARETDKANGNMGSERIDDWEVQAKLRKRWWRRECEKEGYNEIFDIIPRPHNLLPKPRTSLAQSSHTSHLVESAAQPTRPPDYNLPRYLSLSPLSHPFHPSFLSYIRRNPSSRVYWSIPICGPTIVPTYSDPINKVSPTPSIHSKAPIPSGAILLHGHDATTSPPKQRGEVVWTPNLLRHFWMDFLVPLHADLTFPFGQLSVMISGPKPDPFLALHPVKPLPPWLIDGHLSATQADKGEGAIIGPSGNGGSAIMPVRPEMGDHIRLYCPAKYALSLRTWLHSIEVDLDSIASRSPSRSAHPSRTSNIHKSGEERSTVFSEDRQSNSLHRIFEKARFVLVGPRGEALIVA